MARRRDRIVQLSKYQTSENFHLLNEVESYWEALREDSTVPHRQDIDPRGLERALDNIFYVEKLGAGVIRFRLAGRVVEEAIGMDPRGMPLSALFASRDRERLRQLVSTALTMPEVLRMRLQSVPHPGQQVLQGGMIILPLRDERGWVTKALGCFQLSPSAGSSPQASTIRSVSTRALSDARVRPEKMPPLIEEACHAFGEDPAKFHHRRQDRVNRPALRVVKS